MKWFYIVLVLLQADDGSWHFGNPFSGDQEYPVNFDQQTIEFDSREECEEARIRIIEGINGPSKHD